MASKSSAQRKQFKVTGARRNIKKLILYQSFETFVAKCKEKFNIPQTDRITIVTEDEGYEVDDDENMFALDNGLKLMVLRESEIWTDINEADEIQSEISDSVCDQNGPEAKEVQSEKPDSVCDQNGQEVQPETPDSVCDDNAPDDTTLLDYIKKCGLRGIDAVLTKSLSDWKNVPINIAVTGRSGTGKSSFINRMRNISDMHDMAAKVGVTETTTECKAYPHPHAANVLFWDVPGCGTEKFPRDSYAETIKMSSYDVFIVCTVSRFTEDDEWLSNEITKLGKNFFFVRTKVDIDIFCDRFSKGSGIDKDATLGEIRDDCKKQLKAESIGIFLISNHNPQQYDFPELCSKILESLPNEKKNAFSLTVAVITKHIIEEKRILLNSRIWKVALASGVGAAVPVPWLSTAIDVAIILKEVLFYREQFGLDDESLQSIAKSAGVTFNTLKLSVDLETPVTLFTASGLVSYLSKYALSEVAEKTVQFAIPVVGTLIGSGMSYVTTYGVLLGLLEMMKEDAKKILIYAITIKHSSV